MKRLFYVKNTKTGKAVRYGDGDCFFYGEGSKKTAKRYRDELNEEHGSKDKPSTQFIVSRGPDHWRSVS